MTETEMLSERFVLDKSDCVDGGDGCKAEMRHSIAGAFVYNSELTALRDQLAQLKQELADAKAELVQAQVGQEK